MLPGSTGRLQWIAWCRWVWWRCQWVKSHRSKARVHGQRQKGDLNPVGVAFLDIFGTSRPLSQKLKDIEIWDLLMMLSWCSCSCAVRVSHAFGYLISVSEDGCRHFDDSLRWKECGYAVCGWSQRYRCSWWSRSNDGFEHRVPCCRGRHGFKCYIHCCGLQCWDQGWLKRGWCWVPLGSSMFQGWLMHLICQCDPPM